MSRLGRQAGRTARIGLSVIAGAVVGLGVHAIGHTSGFFLFAITGALAGAWLPAASTPTGAPPASRR